MPDVVQGIALLMSFQLCWFAVTRALLGWSPSLGRTTVVLAQQFLVSLEDRLAGSKGEAALTLVRLYKALGGGWEPWQDASVVSEANATEMSARTNWGDLVTEHEQKNVAQAASHGTEQDRGWWRWRWWRPQW